MNENCDNASGGVALWNQCLAIIKDNIGEEHFNTWFVPMVPESYENHTLTLQVPSPFFAEFIDAHYSKFLKKVFDRVIGPDTNLVYNVVAESAERTKVPVKGFNAPVQNVGRYNPFEQHTRPAIDPQLNPNYTFDKFVEGECNKIGREVGMSVAKTPYKGAFSPLFIYGGSGLGKTHLAQAIGWEVLNRYPEKIVLYVDANRFQQQYTDAHLNQKTNEFLQFYQQIDVLIVDDIQFFAGKTGTQGVFFQIFNHLHQLGKQIILTSDCPANTLQGLEQRILSRFKWGVTVELSKPSHDTRIAILESKVVNDGLLIPGNVLEFIAENVTENIRELEGVIVSMLAQSTLTRTDINVALAERVIGRIVETTEKTISVQTIQQTVCDYYHLDIKSIQDKSRKREVVQARQIAMYFSRKLTKNSLSAIGKQIGGKDHATVLYACKAVEDQLSVDRSFRTCLDEIEERIK